jgi:tetratricopeptide (TPR) repeat protein
MLFALFLLVCLAILPAAGQTITTGISAAAADTSGPPPQNVSVYLSEAKAAVAERNWTNALIVTTRGIAWYPDSADLLCLQGYTFRKTGQYQKSVDVISRGISLDPKPVRFANRGYGYLALKNYTAALADAESGISLDAAYPTTYGVKALALHGMGRNPEALAAIGKALERGPDNAHYWHVKGILLSAQGDCPGAAAALEKSLGIDPNYDLPYPGFKSAQESLETLNATCAPATQAPAHPSPTKSSPGGIAVIGLAGAVIALGMRK